MARYYLIAILISVISGTVFGKPFEIIIATPALDCVVSESELKLAGQLLGAPPGQRIDILVNNQHQLTHAVENNAWELKVPLVDGPNAICIKCSNAKEKWLLAAKVPPLQHRGKLKVHLDWMDGSHAKIKQIAKETMNELEDSEAEELAKQVASRVPFLLQEVFEEAGVTLYPARPGADVHSIHVSPGAHLSQDNRFGHTPPHMSSDSKSILDYGDTVKDDNCYIYLDAISASMRGIQDFSINWSPMLYSDEIETREADLSHIIAHACAHELGHCLGLVGSWEGYPGGWMLGEEGHDCKCFVKRMSGIAKAAPSDLIFRRFGRGHFVMDGGLDSDVRVRTGRVSLTLPGDTRTEHRTWVKFNMVSSAYLFMLYGD